MMGRFCLGALLVFGIAFGQSVAPPNPDWRKVGSSSVDLMLASPATGPVDEVWFSADGSRLYARTRTGLVFETLDLENWGFAAAPRQPAPPGPAFSVARLPASAARLVFPASNAGRVYALGNHLYRSDDGGRSWTNLSAFKTDSVIGSGQHSLAVSPNDPDQLVVANDYGVWRSLDGGLSWSGLNQSLPNLMIRRMLSTPNGLSGTRILADGLGTLELPPGNTTAWQPVADPQMEQEAKVRQDYSRALGAEITTVAGSGDTVYAGSADGRIWVSFDRGQTWSASWPSGAGPVERLFVDPKEPRIALAALGGTGAAAHVLRTTNSGAFWDNVTSNLPDVAAHAVTADRTAGAVYVATDKGVFFTRTDLENPVSPSAWSLLTLNLPSAPATDVKLDPSGNQLYIALTGYGIYAAAAPHRAGTLRLVNAADFSSRPAAPGSLFSVVGGRVNSAKGGDLEFPVLAASDAESQVQVPFEATGSNLSLALLTQQGRFTFPLLLQPVSPAIFISPDGTPMLLDADSGLMLDARNTAHSAARIQILATGLGKVRPQWPSGVAAPLENPPVVAATVRAYLDRVPLPVTRATLAPGYIGLYLVELQLPAIVNAGPAELYITADGQESNRVQVFLEP